MWAGRLSNGSKAVIIVAILNVSIDFTFCIPHRAFFKFQLQIGEILLETDIMAGVFQ